MRQELTVLILSALPIAELRVSIPFAIGIFKFLPAKALVIALIGNMIPIPFLWYGLPRLLRWAEAHSPRLHLFLQSRLRGLSDRNKKSYDRFGSLALAMFVAVPIPGTGVWAGTALAVIFGIRPKYAVPALILGDIVAGVIVTLATTGTIRIIAL